MIMKYSFLSVFFILILSTIVRADFETANQCKNNGFIPGTKKFGDGEKELPDIANTNRGVNGYSDLSEFIKKNKCSNSLKFKEAIYLGEVKKGKAHGVGFFTFLDGSTYEGKVSKNRIHGKGKYINNQGKVYKGKFKYGSFTTKIDNKIREFIKLKPKTGIESGFEIRGTGAVSTKWFEAEKNSSGTFKLTPKGKRDMDRAIQNANSDGSGGSEDDY